MEANRGLKAAMLAVAMVALASTAVSASMTGEQRCQFFLAIAKGKYERCVQKRLAREYTGGSLDQAKLAKCRIRYTTKWNRLHGLGATCSSPRYTDNGDGTVTDNLTGLVWEKKTSDGSIHDKDNLYTWSTAFPWVENGTVFSEFLSGLNAGGGFAGATGWRLPTFAELQTILLPEKYPCTTSPCIDSTFGPTQPYFYWSATALGGFPGFAWIVSFVSGSVGYDFETDTLYARAVRGGL
jgi:hypothetical protein